MLFERLCDVAYRKERVLARRLAAKMAMPEEQALEQVLMQVAGERPLDELIAERLRQAEDAAANLAARRQKRAEEREKRCIARRPDSSSWLAWFDGSTRPNPGKMGIGGVLKSPDGNVVEISFASGHGDSNQAEYLALIAVLQEAVRIQPPKLAVYGDSQVVIEQVKGMNNAGAMHLRGLHAQVKQLLSQLDAVSLHLTPRKNNAEADALSQQCFSQDSDAV